MSRYSLITHWHLDAPIDRVWEAIVAVEDWPRWWRYVRRVEELTKGDADGCGALRRYTWSSRLPYRLSFAMRVTRVERPSSLEGVAEGDLSGTGCWHLAPEAGTTRVRYDWTCVPLEPQSGHGGGRTRSRAALGREPAFASRLARRRVNCPQPRSRDAMSPVSR